MAVVGILALMAFAAVLGAWAAWDYFWSTQADRERALQKQVTALQASLEISQQAWSARAAMHQEADRLRRSQSSDS